MLINNVFTVPDWVRKIEEEYSVGFNDIRPEAMKALKTGLSKFSPENPEVTISIPVYNEEKNILKTLASFARMQPKYATELLFVNNNSSDRTGEILEKLGVKTILEKKQGISFARQTGLENARGKYLLNADGDSIYPEGWIDTYVEHLKNPATSCVYGTYSFIPSNSWRFTLSLYEFITRLLFLLRRKKMDYFNVLGFNFAFRREDGVKVGGFNTKRLRWSDCWMAMTLLDLGKIELIRKPEVRVWTSDRRLVYDGGLFKAILKRMRKETDRYVQPPEPKVEIEKMNAK